MIADIMNSAYKLALQWLPKKRVAAVSVPATAAASESAPPHPFFAMELMQLCAPMEISPGGLLTVGKKKDLRIEADELMANLKILIVKASIQGYGKTELLDALRVVLQSYSCLIGTLYEAPVLLFIGRTVQRQFEMEVFSEELRQLWR